MSVWDEPHSFASTLQLLGLNISAGGKEEVTRDETGCITGTAQIICGKKGGNSQKKKVRNEPIDSRQRKGKNPKDVELTKDVERSQVWP